MPEPDLYAEVMKRRDARASAARIPVATPTKPVQVRKPRKRCPNCSKLFDEQEFDEHRLSCAPKITESDVEEAKMSTEVIQNVVKKAVEVIGEGPLIETLRNINTTMTNVNDTLSKLLVERKATTAPVEIKHLEDFWEDRFDEKKNIDTAASLVTLIVVFCGGLDVDAVMEDVNKFYDALAENDVTFGGVTVRARHYTKTTFDRYSRMARVIPQNKPPQKDKQSYNNTVNRELSANLTGSKMGFIIPSEAQGSGQPVKLVKEGYTLLKAWFPSLKPDDRYEKEPWFKDDDWQEFEIRDVM